MTFTLNSVNSIFAMISKELKDLYIEFSLNELIEKASSLIQLYVPKQTRYKVTDFPDARTVRFYTARRLLDKPDRYNGQQAIYGQKHLLQLIVIKYFQSQYLSIKKIGEVIRGLSRDELLDLIEKTQMVDFKSAYLEIVSHKMKCSDVLEVESLTKNKNLIGEKVWNRYTLEAGFEVHINEDFLPESPSHIEVLANRIRVILKQINKEKGRVLCQ